MTHRFLVLSRPRQLESEDELHDYALRALSRRAHSVQEMKQKLARRTRNDLLVQVVIARLKEAGRLDDSRFAGQFARQRSEVRKQGKFRIARDLRARGVDDRRIQAAIEESSAHTDEALVVRQRIEKKLKFIRGSRSAMQLDERKLASLYSSLLRAGFSADVVRRELKSLTREEIPAAEPPDDAE